MCMVYGADEFVCMAFTSIWAIVVITTVLGFLFVQRPDGMVLIDLYMAYPGVCIDTFGLD